MNNDKFKIILMIGLIIIMLVLAIVIFNYTKQMKLNPCDFCSECKNLINLTELKGGLN